MADLMFLRRTTTNFYDTTIDTSSLANGQTTITTASDLTAKIRPLDTVRFGTDTVNYTVLTIPTTTTFTITPTYVAGVTGTQDIKRAQHHYLYLPSDSHQFGGMGKPIMPALPGNDSTTVFGGKGNNFIFNLGIQQPSLRISTAIVEVTSAQYPTPMDLMSGSDRDLYLYDGSSGGTGTAATQTAKNNRSILIEYWANQSSSSYIQHALGWPSWGSSSGTASFNGQSGYRIWEGTIPDPPTIIEDGGVSGYFPCFFNFVIGDWI